MIFDSKSNICMKYSVISILKKPSNLIEHNNYTVKEYKFSFSQRNLYCMVSVSQAVIKMVRLVPPLTAPWQPFYEKCMCSACFSEGCQIHGITYKVTHVHKEAGLHPSGTGEEQGFKSSCMGQMW